MIVIILILNYKNRKMSVTTEYMRYKNTRDVYKTIIKTSFFYLKKEGKIKYFGDVTQKKSKIMV